MPCAPIIRRLGCCLYRPVGTDGSEGVGPAGKKSVSVDKQHPDVVLALLLQKHTRERWDISSWKPSRYLLIDERQHSARGAEITLCAGKGDQNTCKGESAALKRGRAWHPTIKPNGAQVNRKHICVSGSSLTKHSRGRRGPLDVRFENCLDWSESEIGMSPDTLHSVMFLLSFRPPDWINSLCSRRQSSTHLRSLSLSFRLWRGPAANHLAGASTEIK